MRVLRLPKSVWVAGLFLFCFLVLPKSAGATDPYEGMKWKFSVPVKCYKLMRGAPTVVLNVKVLGPGGDVIAELPDPGHIIRVPADGKVDTVVVLELDPKFGKNPFLAEKYVVDMTLVSTKPAFDHPSPYYRAKAGTELVHHIEEPMPEARLEVDGAGPGAGTGQNRPAAATF